MGANCSSPKTNLRKRPMISKTPSTKHLMHHGHGHGPSQSHSQSHSQRSPTKYKTAKTDKEKEAIEQMKYIEAKINKLMLDQIERDNKLDNKFDKKNII